MYAKIENLKDNFHEIFDIYIFVLKTFYGIWAPYTVLQYTANNRFKQFREIFSLREDIRLQGLKLAQHVSIGNPKLSNVKHVAIWYLNTHKYFFSGDCSFEDSAKGLQNLPSRIFHEYPWENERFLKTLWSCSDGAQVELC